MSSITNKKGYLESIELALTAFFHSLLLLIFQYRINSLEMMPLKKKIFTISGLHGTGKTTVGKRLAELLNIRYYSTGEAFRELAKEFNLSLEDFTKYVEQNPQIDKELDQKIVNIASEGNILIDSQLGGKILENIAEFSILLTCPLNIRVKRMAERDNSSFEEKLQETLFREKSELQRFKSLYNIDLNDKKQVNKIYDLIIDTQNLTIEEVVKKIISVIEKKNALKSDRKTQKFYFLNYFLTKKNLFIFTGICSSIDKLTKNNLVTNYKRLRYW